MLGRRLFVSFIVLTPLSDRVASGLRDGHAEHGRDKGCTLMRTTSPSTLPSKSPFVFRAIRTRPQIYSAICKARLSTLGAWPAAARNLYKSHSELFQLNAFETRQLESVRRHGYALAPSFFPSSSSTAYLQKLRPFFEVSRLMSSAATRFKQASGPICRACPTTK